MNQEFFTNLPSEIIIHILSRLPVRTIIHCKYVCKSWLNLLETHEFAKSHLSKSVPGLAIHQSATDSEPYKIFEFEDGLDLQHHELHYNLVTKLDFPHDVLIEGSASGLLLLRDLHFELDPLYICNPITHDFIELPHDYVYSIPQVVTYGFGASKMTGQHKVVRIFHDCIHDQGRGELLEVTKSGCEIYSLGTRSWRNIAPGAPFKYSRDTIGAFLNGNLHWFVYDLKGSPWISCFDLEIEVFSTSSLPLLQAHNEYCVGVFALRDCLCVSDNTSSDDIVIWLMKEYGVEKSWTKEFVISKNLDFPCATYEVVYPIKIFKDGDILMAWGHFLLFYYSEKTKTTQIIDMFEPDYDIQAILHTPSFFSLKNFGMENVTSF